MASWWMEGFCARLLDSEDPVTKKLLNRCVLYVVPHMNPDGASRGHLRTNAKGANLNREWADPKLSYAPEVFHVRKKMDEAGVDLMLASTPASIPEVGLMVCEAVRARRRNHQLQTPPQAFAAIPGSAL